jgi:ComF family protein
MPQITSTTKIKWPSRCGTTLARLLPSTCQLQVEQAQDAGWEIDTCEQYCHRCGSTIGPEAVTQKGCPLCINDSIAWDRLLRMTAYQDPMTGWIVQMKYARAWTWAQWIGKQLATQIENAPNRRPGEQYSDTNNGRRTAVCAVPMHWLRRWSRGFNQAQLIAQSIAKAKTWPVAPILKRTRRTALQTNLTPSQRARNIADSVAIESVDLGGWDIWLVDDVKTTGSTLNLCARLLRKAGAETINVAVAAVADPKHADFQVV